MDRESKYDFLSMGARYAKEAGYLIKKTAEEIEKKYGKEAKFEFETGVAYVMPQYIVTNTYEYNNNVRGTKCFANTDAENSKKGNK